MSYDANNQNGMSAPHPNPAFAPRCAQCGEPIPNHHTFCTNCGASFNTVPPQQQFAPIGRPGLGIYAGANGMGGTFYGNNPMARQGGVIQHSNVAQNIIRSSVITEFSTNFFVYDKEDQSLSGSYYFTLKQDNGKLILREDYKYCIQEEVTPDVFGKIQKIIIDNNLTRLNGQYDVKQGLPAECQPCHFKAVYDSGEVLNFTMNSIPYIPWAQELAYTLRMELAKRGHKECLAPRSATNITNFIIRFREGDLDYSYNKIVYNELDSKRYIERFIFNKSRNNIESDTSIEVGEQFYTELHEYVQSHCLNRLRDVSVSNDDWKFGKARYYDIYIGYENGNRIIKRSANTADCNQFYQEISELKAFFDRYIDAPNAVIRKKVSFVDKPFSLDSL